MKQVSYKRVVLQSTDTDIFTTLGFHIGKGHKFRRIDVVESVKSFGAPEAQDLAGLYNLTGAN